MPGRAGHHWMWYYRCTSTQQLLSRGGQSLLATVLSADVHAILHFCPKHYLPATCSTPFPNHQSFTQPLLWLLLEEAWEPETGVPEKGKQLLCPLSFIFTHISRQKLCCVFFFNLICSLFSSKPGTRDENLEATLRTICWKAYDSLACYPETSITQPFSVGICVEWRLLQVKN